MAGLARISEDMRRAERIVGDSMAKVEKSARNARSAMETLTAGFGAMVALQQIKQMSDGYTKLDAQLRLSTKNQREYNQALADVQRISTVAQTNIGATSMLYTRMLNVTRGMNIEQSKIATVAETVSYGLKAYGATAAEASSASLQLSQAMGANRLGGEEFRAVMEAMPNVMKVLADSMGVPLGELRALSIAGKITTDVMLKAFGNPEIAAQMRRAAEQTRTIGGELVVMSNNAMQFVGSMMKLSGAQGGVIGLISGMSEALKLAVTYVAQITSLLLTLAAVYAGKYVLGLVQAYRATLAMNAAQVEATAMNLAMARSAQVGAKANLVQASQVALLTGNTKLATAARIEYMAVSKAADAAEALQMQATMTRMAKFSAFVAANRLGLIGVALWGIYAIADHMGWIDKLSNRLGDFFDTQESHIRRLKTIAGGGAGGEAMERAIETVAKQEALRIAAEARAKEYRAQGISETATDVEAAAAMIAKLEKQLRAKGAEYALIRARNMGGAEVVAAEAQELNLRLQTYKQFQLELGKTTGPNLPADALTAIAGGDQLFVNTTFAEIVKKFNEGKLSAYGFKKEILDMYAALSEKQKSGAAKVDPNSWRIAMFERLTAESQATGKQLTNVEAVAAAEAKAHDKKIKLIITEAELLDAARAADTRGIVIAAGERVKGLEQSIATIERERAAAVNSSRDMLKYDDQLLVAEQDKLWYMIQSTDQLDAQLALLKEIDAIQEKRDAIKTPAQFMDVFGGKNRDGAYDEMFKGLITGAITDWRDMIKSFGNAFKTKVIDYMAKMATDVMSKMGENVNMWLAIASAVIVASGVLNKWEQSKQPANVSLTGGRGGVGGSVATLWERDAGWFAQKEYEFKITGLTAKQSAVYNASLQSIADTYTSAGDALGYADTSTRAFTVSLTTNGDVTAALANQIGAQLVPAIILFQREGENLQATAQRLTDTFRATGDLLTATGVSAMDAFGGMGLQSAAARESLVAASGGLSTFTSNSKSFIDNFLTNAEKLAPAADEVARTFERLGVTGVSTNDQFAQLVKTQLELGNTDAVAELLSVSGAFDSLTTSAMKAAEAITGILAKNTFSTMVDWLRASKTAGSAAALIATASAGLGTTLDAEQAGSAAALIATASAGLGTTLDAEQAGTATYTAANAAAIAQAQAEAALALTEITDAPSMWQMIIAVIKELMGLLWEAFKQLIDDIWVGFRDMINELWVTIRDFITSGGGLIPGGIGGIVDTIFPGLGGLFANGGTFGATHAFADGSAFTNNMYSSPTPFMFADGGGFSNGVMGEAGPEAVMPLKRDGSGRLGVSVNGGGNSSVIVELQAMRNELSMLRAESRAENNALVGTAQRTERILDKWDHNGMPEVVTI
jgi:tape measure domain-containing protein